jgi:hypothetical protein
MDITKKHNTEIYKDEQPCCSSLYISVLCFLVMSMLLIFIYFCVMFFGDVHVAHLYISVLCFLDMDITSKHTTEIYKDEQHCRHHQKT